MGWLAGSASALRAAPLFCVPPQGGVFGWRFRFSPLERAIFTTALQPLPFVVPPRVALLSALTLVKSPTTHAPPPAASSLTKGDPCQFRQPDVPRCGPRRAGVLPLPVGRSSPLRMGGRPCGPTRGGELCSAYADQLSGEYGLCACRRNFRPYLW